MFEVYPKLRDEDAYLPVHLLHLVEMGLTQGQNWVPHALADDCAGDGRYSFLLDATPLPLTHGLGMPSIRSPSNRGAIAGVGVGVTGAVAGRRSPQRRSGTRPRALTRWDLRRRSLSSRHGPMQGPGLRIDQVARPDPPEFEAVAVRGHAGEHGHERAGDRHRVGAGG